MLAEWSLHYEEWIIGDGEPDRHVDDVFDWFALAFWGDKKLGKVNERESRRFLSPISGTES